MKRKQANIFSTETWLHLRDIVKPFVQYQHIQAVIKALNSVPPSFSRLKKNYILILGVYAPEELIQFKDSLSKQDKEDYIIKDAYNLAIKGKVSELFQEIEPSILGQYYSTKQLATGSEKQPYSL